MSELVYNNNKSIQVKAMNPIKFALWLFIVTIVMIFASLTSAYIVKKADGNWLVFELPQMFQYTSILIILSSLTMYFAYISAKIDELLRLKVWLGITILLSFCFMVGQYLSWEELVLQDVYFIGNPAGSFIYVFTGLHVIHLVGGVIFLLIVLYKSFNYEVHAKKLNLIEMCSIFWHFLGGLWIYLYLFLILNS